MKIRSQVVKLANPDEADAVREALERAWREARSARAWTAFLWILVALVVLRNETHGGWFVAFVLMYGSIIGIALYDVVCAHRLVKWYRR